MRIPKAHVIAATIRRNSLDDMRIDARVGVVRKTTTRRPKKTSKRVIQTKGGGTPQVPSAMEQTNATIALEQARNQMAQEQAARNKAAADAERAAQVDKARSAQANAYNSAISYGTNQVANKGLLQSLVDKYNVLGAYNSAIDTQRGQLGETDVNPIFSTSTAFNDAVSNAQGAYRSGTRNDFNKLYGDDFATNTFSDASDDAILQSILDTRRADALSTIDAAKARGQLNDVGYGRAITGLDEQSKSGMSTLQSLGQGVLSGYRDDINTMRNNELDKIGGLDLTQLYSSDAFGNNVNQRISDDRNNLEGNIFKALGNTSLFDPSTIISGSGAVQGYYNPTKAKTTTSNNPLLTAFTDDQTKNTTAVGNSGVF